MSNLRVLVVASPSICSLVWLERKLTAALPVNCNIVLIDNNEYLRKAVERLNPQSVTQLSIKNRTKSNIRELLMNTNHVLLFWDGRTMTELIFQARLYSIPIKVYPFETALIVNKEKTSNYDAYIGRGTPWGNPFQVGTQDGQFDRFEAIEKYKNHFEKNILGDKSLHKGLLGLRGMRLACHCKPLACHGDVIAKYLNSQDPELTENK